MAHLEWNAPRIHLVRPRLRLFTQEGFITLQRDGLEWARYDLAGRWRVALVQGITYRRSLSGRVIGIRYFLEDALLLDEGEEGFHEVEEVPASEWPRLHETVQAWASEALDALGPELTEPWRALLEQARVLGPDQLDQDAAAFHRTYRGDPITPPDQHDAVLVQSTTGCAHNACTFCVFYRDTRFSIRPAQAFSRHVEAVRSFLGPTMPSRHRVFFGDASALMVKPSLLAQHFQAACSLLAPEDRPDKPRRLDVPASRKAVGPYSTFCDTFLTPLPEVEELRELARLGLGRVYLGVETGAQDLLDLLRKPATPAGMLAAVRHLKAAGIPVSVIIMVGAGGRGFASLHREETARLLNQMPLGTGDVVQFSEFFSMPGSVYEREAATLALEPLTRLEGRREMRRIRDLLGGLDKPGGARYQMYDARQLLY